MLGSTFRHLFHPHRSNNHRARVLHPEVIVILTLLVVACMTTLTALGKMSSQMGSVLGFASSITPTQVIEQTNQERQKNGLSPLTFNQQLSEAARAKGQNMFLKQYWAHTSPEGLTPWSFIKEAGYAYQVAGENLARDFGDTDSMVSAWMASPTHKANILSPRYQEIGIAVIDGQLEGYETTLVVQMFGSPRSQAAADEALSSGVTTQEVSLEETRQVETILNPSETSETLPEAIIVPTPSRIPGQPPQSPAVLASYLVPQGSVSLPPLFTPLQVIKAIFLGLIMMIVMTLLYDSVIIGNRGAMRMVGKNLAHLVLFTIVAFLLISFKGGILG